MSRDLHDFATAFLQGINVGLTHWDRSASVAANRERWAQVQRQNADKNDRESYKLGEWAKTQAAYRSKLGAQTTKLAGTGTAGAAAGPAAFVDGMSRLGVPVDEPAQRPQVTVNVPEQVPPPPGMPSEEASPSIAGDDTYRRGGTVRSAIRFDEGGTVSPLQAPGVSGPGSGFGEIDPPPPAIRFAGGGSVPAQDDQGRYQMPYEGALTTRINDMVGPPDEPQWSPSGDWAAEGAREKIREARIARMVSGLPVGSDPALQNDLRKLGDDARDRDKKALAGRQSGWSGEEGRADERPRGRSDFVGEEARADETGAGTPPPFVGDEARANERPGGGAGGPPVGPVGGPAGVAGGGGGSGAGGAGAIRLGLGDQRRTAAFDPTADDLDPRNVHAVDRWGQTNLFQAAAPTAGGPPQPRMPGSAMADTNSPANAGMSSNNAANDMTAIMQNVTGYAQQQFHLGSADEHSGRGYNALLSGRGADDPNAIHAAMVAVDPKGQMPLHQRMLATIKAAHDYYASRGDHEKAAKVSFEIAQFGSKMARQHGQAAVGQLQKGNTGAALNDLMAGYNWLPDDHTADMDPSGKALVLRDNSGRVTSTVPLDATHLQNLALGMATGQLQWDVYKSRAQATGAPPGAGPQPAPAPGASPSGQPAPASAPLPGATPLAGASPAASAAPPGAAPVGAINTQQSSITGAGNPPPPVASPAPPAAGPSLGASSLGAPAGSPAPAASPQAGPGQADPWQKDPEHVPDDVIRRGSRDMRPVPPDYYDKLRGKAQSEYDAKVKYVNELAAKTLGKGQSSYRTQALSKLATQHREALQDINHAEDLRSKKEENMDRQESSRIRDRQSSSLQTEQNLNQHFETMANDMVDKYKKFDPEQEAGKGKGASQDFSRVQQSALRYMQDPKSRNKLYDVARVIWQHNPDLSEEEAFNHALTFTSFVSDKSKGLNGHPGQKGTWYKAAGTDPLANVVLTNQSGERVHVPAAAMTQIRNLRRANYENFKDDMKMRSKDAGERKSRGSILRRMTPGATPEETGNVLGSLP